MKQKIYILGVITTMFVFLGAIFKVNHWPGAGIMLTAGLLSVVFLFLPLALINHFRSEDSGKNLSLYIITWLTCLVIFISMLFKLMHWPGAGVLLTIALPFPYIVFLPVFLSVVSKNKRFNVYNTVFVLLLLALNSVFAALLALNVSAERIRDSYNLSSNYNNIEKVLNQLPSSESQSTLKVKINEVLRNVDEYKELILRGEGTSIEQWENGVRNIRHDSRQAALSALSAGRKEKVGENLDNSLNDLIRELKNVPGEEKLADAIPLIFDLRLQYDDDPNPVYHNITNVLSWSLIYLDGMETHLKLIKASLDN